MTPCRFGEWSPEEIEALRCAMPRNYVGKGKAMKQQDWVGLLLGILHDQRRTLWATIFVLAVNLVIMGLAVWILVSHMEG